MGLQTTQPSVCCCERLKGMSLIKRLLITPGEPAGIGPDITIQAAQLAWPSELIAIADPLLLQERAEQLHLPLKLIDVDLSAAPTQHQPGTLKMLASPLTVSAKPGRLDVKNAQYVINTLQQAAELCKNKTITGLVTGPVQKSIINESGIAFSGHTEFFADYCHVPQTVMLFVVEQLKIALVTTHLPISAVAGAITPAHLENIITVLQTGLKQQFHIDAPRIFVCGLNPHAGENGHLGKEEIEVITPTLNRLRQQGYHLEGPFSADTIFTPKYTEQADVILAMFHDQALPLVKYIGFGQAVNVTLGLPFIRTSVDHGTALDMAGTGKADAGSMHAAIRLAITLQNGHC